MDCTAATHALLAFDRRELPEAHIAAVRGHLEGCARCRAELRSNRELSAAFARAQPAPHPGFVAGVLAAIAVARQVAVEGGTAAAAAAAARELQEALYAQALHLREAAWAMRRRLWSVSLSVAAHAAVLLVCALLVLGSDPPLSRPRPLAMVAVVAEILPPEGEGSGSRGSELAAPFEVDPHLVVVTAFEGGDDEGPAPLPMGEGPDAPAPTQPGRGRAAATTAGLDPDNEELWRRLSEVEPVPPEQARPAGDPALLAGRFDPAVKRAVLSEYAGPLSVESAIGSSLSYLASHQSADGSWDPLLGGGDATLRAAVTALAVLPFLAEGFHSEGGSSYERDVVRPAIDYLQSLQLPGGGIHAEVGGRAMFNHMLATLALSENLALLSPPAPAGRRAAAEDVFRGRALAVHRAVQFLERWQIRPGLAPAERSGAGGWGYLPGSTVTDTNVSAWGVQALAAYEQALVVARRGGVAQLGRVYRSIRHWLSTYTDPLTAEVGYNGFRRYGSYGTLTLTAVGLLAGNLSERRDADPVRDTQAQLLLQHAPTFGLDEDYEEPDYTRGYFTAAALYFQDRGSLDFRKWYRRAVDELLQMQVTEPGSPETGSWPPICRWSRYGGRIAVTSLAALTLQLPYRFAR